MITKTKTLQKLFYNYKSVGFSQATLSEWMEFWKNMTRPKEDHNIVVYLVCFKVDMENSKRAEDFV